ncbi:unnamed protein product [Moneuplotes crassus]|uniref:Uncharacterized protein n=1 Tax=Euplotes crassus TaxID=5936 RepID=A0AAD1XK98_EUPCR|nr:unnamed protein product [Moneuplotes crassus]
MDRLNHENIFLEEGGEQEQEQEILNNAQENTSHLVKSKYPNAGKIVETLYEEKDCLKILFRIKKLEIQVKYLLSRDVNYVELQKHKPRSRPAQQNRRSNILSEGKPFSKRESVKDDDLEDKEELKFERIDDSIHQLVDDPPNLLNIDLKKSTSITNKHSYDQAYKNPAINSQIKGDSENELTQQKHFLRNLKDKKTQSIPRPLISTSKSVSMMFHNQNPSSESKGRMTKYMLNFEEKYL